MKLSQRRHTGTIEHSPSTGPQVPRRRQISVKGMVQGVGFRPFVYRLAEQLKLVGYVCNTSEGVLIEIQGMMESLNHFEERLRTEAPELSRIESVQGVCVPIQSESDFSIHESKESHARLCWAPADIASCRVCMEEARDPQNRRFQYPFTSCTNCGPRYSILRALPYDRLRTTMGDFIMCDECRAEYDNPADRRFHAQTNACPLCGPRLRLVGADADHSLPFTATNILETVANLIASGKIVAWKGLGGYQLISDGRNAHAVRRLRERKRRGDKPFAVMVRNTAIASSICEVSSAEESLLEGKERPIVLLRKRTDSSVAIEVAPALLTLGVMLPYTPLHDLLFFHLDEKVGPGSVLVMTSGNVSDEPILTDDSDAEAKLSRIADAFVHHDRRIHTAVDDSVARVVNEDTVLLRRARGYCPSPVLVGATNKEILACGAQQKSTFCLVKGKHAFLSQHLGDFANYETLLFAQWALGDLRHLFAVDPTIVVRDLHPGYMSSRLAEGLKIEREFSVQHHHAHIASCMAEHGLEEAVIGIAWDGTGLGSDGALWGGEFLVADRGEFQRFAHLRYIDLPGGEQAIREPWRVARSYLHSIFPGEGAWGADLFRPVPEAPIRFVDDLLLRGIQTVATSSCGRLFDAVASLLNLRQTVSYEGQAAAELEAIAVDTEDAYPFTFEGEMPLQIDVRPMVRQILEEGNAGIPPGIVAGKFHNTLIAIIGVVCEVIRARTGLARVCLSGGCFQNLSLLRGAIATLRRRGFQVHYQQVVPMNDGGIALGQAVIARELLKREGC